MRKTIRQYEQRPIGDDLLRQLLERACRASNTGNMQTYSIVLSRDRQVVEALSAPHFNQPMIRNAAAVLTFCADYNRFSHWCRQREAQPCYDNLQSLVGAGIDAMLVAQEFATAAEEAGLGICFLGTTTYNATEICDVLHLPQLVVPVTTVTVGYPAEDPEPQDRLPLDAIVHADTYHDYTDADIDRLYAAKEALPESRHYVEENHVQTLAQVFTQVRYTRENCETFSRKFHDLLVRQGFRL